MTRMPPLPVAAAMIVLVAAVWIMVPAWQLLLHGPFGWHVHQPGFWQGGLEAAALAVLCASAFASAPRRRWLLALAALGLVFYLRRHAIDVALLLDLLYIEIVIGLGAFLRHRFRLPPPTDARDYLQCFVLGFLAWSLLAWFASAIGVGAIGDLRALTVLLAIPAACGRHAPLLPYLWRRMQAGGRVDRIWCALLAVWVVVLYARSKFTYGYDSLWYGLRAEFVLVPGNSIYEPLGLVSPVHYFPKLYELFLLPLAGLGDASVLSGITIWMLVLLLLACAAIAHRLDLPSRARLPVLALIATLPALANTTTPKPDVIAVLFVLLAADAALGFVRSRAPHDAAWLLACGALACLAKLTAIPYVGILLLATLAAAAGTRVNAQDQRGDVRATRLAIAAAAAALVVAGFVTARTWWLTGLPTIGPDPLFQLWHALGFELLPPAGTLEWTRPQDWSDVPALMLDWWFRPQRLPHVVVSWVGNVWLWCALLAFAFALHARRTGTSVTHRVSYPWPLLALAGTGAALALGIRYHVRGSDGNYFLAALLPAILLAAAALYRHGAHQPRLLAVVSVCLPAFVLFQASYAFFSAAWVPGTRAFDFELGRNWKSLHEVRPVALAEAGLGAIGERLRAEPDGVRSVGYAQEPATFWLPGRYEYLLSIGYARPEYVSSVAGFVGFLREQRIDYLILPRRPDQDAAEFVAPAVREAAGMLAASPGVERFDERDYTLYALRDWRAAARSSLPERLRAAPPH